MHKLRLKVKQRFATNTTKLSSGSLVQQLNELGLHVEPHEVFTSLSACRDMVRTRQLRPLLFMEDAALEEFNGIDTENPNAVVVGLAPSKFNYEYMNKAFRLLMQKPGSVPLIAVHKAKYFADKDEALSLGPGGFVQALEFATGEKASVVGKPSKNFLELALRQIGMENTPEDVAIIGDDINNDLGGGALECGLHRYLVRTGKYRHGDEDKIDARKLKVVDSVVDAIEDILSQRPE
ncbi:Haloacid dehalogenase-like hydrolase domain-containing protein 2 [Apophysomyces ossiformis]|uniref:Haloacid dehalogenase-like hydrolase domain-containing protein 2 n=1 Tax=Apophysomyces ossiformis TaxID=679940 RepID=A0A8H7BP72_9FUNG|nr:Haloacid dehalogenase-like hydrolase domain-containing protein 2 [Apophysomyces ossiformis]